MQAGYEMELSIQGVPGVKDDVFRQFYFLHWHDFTLTIFDQLFLPVPCGPTESQHNSTDQGMNWSTWLEKGAEKRQFQICVVLA